MGVVLVGSEGEVEEEVRWEVAWLVSVSLEIVGQVAGYWEMGERQAMGRQGRTGTGRCSILQRGVVCIQSGDAQPAQVKMQTPWAWPLMCLNRLAFPFNLHSTMPAAAQLCGSSCMCDMRQA